MTQNIFSNDKIFITQKQISVQDTKTIFPNIRIYLKVEAVLLGFKGEDTMFYIPNCDKNLFYSEDNLDCITCSDFSKNDCQKTLMATFNLVIIGVINRNNKYKQSLILIAKSKSLKFYFM